jgi:RNA-directed DNA polymerase
LLHGNGEDFSIFYVYNFVIAFSGNLNHLIFIKGILFKFFSARDLRFTLNFMESFSFKDGLNILSWRFLYSDLNQVISTLSFSVIKLHKLKLKNIIKNQSNSEVCSLIHILNGVIFQWSNSYNTSDFFANIAAELDIYLHKIIWRWARRRHPRRTKVWIYEKYWRKFLGSWRFFSVESLTGRVFFLRSHILSSNYVFHLPISLNKFDNYNMIKYEKFYNMRYYKLFHGLSRLLWKKQNGLCFICKRNFLPLSFSNVKVRQVKSFYNNVYIFVMLHSSCVFSCYVFNFLF